MDFRIIGLVIILNYLVMDFSQKDDPVNNDQAKTRISSGPA